MIIPATLHAYQYSYKIQVEIGSDIIIYEREDEGKFRALIADPTQSERKSKIDIELVKVIGDAIDGLFK